MPHRNVWPTGEPEFTTTPTTGTITIPEVTFNLHHPGQYCDKESDPGCGS